MPVGACRMRRISAGNAGDRADRDDCVHAADWRDGCGCFEQGSPAGYGSQRSCIASHCMIGDVAGI